MNRANVIQLQTQSKPTLMARYGITRLALVGSTAARLLGRSRHAGEQDHGRHRS
ncbi:MAG: hypothetical protein IPL29_04390 [Propionivibrio sp.]|uniref:hypothetical protein n=1 Tax=Propionivibrio sp. TaxID=2212460 RepID=UPI0025E82E8E|nr:hypothetical protein [Propionivibrio sp.]MBK8400304.1 hypothetical protein [Propionivibrio sp.]MBK8892993.1 hypothetical protein [Propionivibrio sp.]